ncbi:SDR family oxidoreductase [uncultured Nitratireductor sp.]|uniref:SDR family oxidoreductase n=1 Tax=uncultured Nitratireductor sp. TaxID=520953 RepID=UPI0026012E33|nr:SDR family oxidoreductase [uncultured Nitratireductor sp.]
MRILVLGGYGFIGLEVMRRLAAAGHEPVGLGRTVEAGRRLAPQFEWIGFDIATARLPADWLAHLAGIDAVVNCAGALQSGARDNLEALQHDAMIALFAACEAAGVDRFIQISAPGASPCAATEFMRTKGMADARLRESDLDWIVLKPGLVIGQNAYGGTALLRMLAGFPFILPLVHPKARVGTVSIRDLTDLVVAAVSPAFVAGRDIELVERDAGTLADVALAFRRWLGFPAPRRVVSLPVWLGAAVGFGADALGLLGWRSPLRSTAMAVMAGGIDGDDAAFRAAMRRPVARLGETLAHLPATSQERWFSRLSLALPLAIALLAVFWFLSGLIGFLRFDAATGLLTTAGFPGAVSAFAVFAGSLVDMVLGLAILYRPFARRACLGMLVVSVLYLLAGTTFLPQLWLDPLGPYMKVLPGTVLAWMTALLLEER